MYSRQQAEKLQKMIKDGDNKSAKAFLDGQGHRAKELCCLEVPRDGMCIHVAARTGNIDMIKEILKQGVDINIGTKEGNLVSGFTALHNAVKASKIGAVEFLIKQGANVNLQEADGQSPLVVACQYHNTDIVRLLVGRGADVNLRDNAGQTPLLHSIVRAPEDMSIYLIEHGGDMHVTDNDGQTALHYAAEWDSINVVCALLEHGAAINVQDNAGRTPLHVCSDQSVFDTLVEQGACQKIRDHKGRPPRAGAIDTKTEQCQNINQALSRHQQLSPTKAAHASRVLDERCTMRVFSPGPPIPEAELKAAKTNMLKELQQKKGGPKSIQSPRGAPASTMEITSKMAAAKIK